MAEQTSFIEKLKHYLKELFYFLTSGIFLKNFLGMLLTVVFCILMTFWWLRCYTKHGQSLSLPSFVNMTLEEAQEKADRRGFVLMVNDSVSRPELPPAYILDQSPKPESRVKEDRTIYLQVTKTVLDNNPLPQLAGNYNYYQYSAKCERWGFKTVIKEKQFDAKQAENTILYFYHDGKKITQKDIEEGMELPDGSTLEFVITTRSGSSVELPNLVCQPYSEAKFIVESYQLNVGSIITDATIQNVETSYVWKQVPEYNYQQIPIGGVVDLYLTQYRPDNCNTNSY